MGDNRNLILALVLSVAVLFAFELLYTQDRPPAPETGQAGEQIPDAPAADPGSAEPLPALPGTATPTIQTREKVLAVSPRVRINTPRVHGSIALKGGIIDDLTLADYRETLDPDSPEIVLLIPRGADTAYYASFGWVAPQGAGVKLPDADTVWFADAEELAPDNPVTLRWSNGEGLTFERTFVIDENFMFTVTQRVTNSSGEAVTLFPYALVSRRTTPPVTGFFILHEGLLGVFDGKLEEIDYEDMVEERERRRTSTGGWIGITDKYWLAALVPDQQEKTEFRKLHTKDGTVDKYQVDYLGGAVTIAPDGGTGETQGRLFAGAKEVQLLDYYAETLGIKNFDLAIDFGWFFFLTKPIFYALIYVNEWVGNLGVAILILTVGIKLVLFPLANKSYKAMSKMKKLQPEMKKLQERFKEDKVRLNQEMMALYKKEKTNPASGCLPIIPQIFVFFALYKVLFVTIEMRQAPFFGWIQDLSAPDPTSLFNAFGLIPWTPPEFLLIGIWPIVMGLTMYAQQKLNPTPPDPIQQKIFMFLPIVFTIMLARFPAGLVIYWTWNNLLSIAQQWYIMHSMGVKIGGGPVDPKT